jgi:hypothetical protein
VTGRVERWSWRAGAVALVAAAVAGTVAGPGSFLLGSVTGSAATTREAPCLPGREVPVMNSPHVSPAELAGVRHNSFPPTSGPHFGFTVAPGIYRNPVPAGLTVHAMEHGHVVIQYPAGAPPELVRRLEPLAKRYAGDVILAPHPELDRGVALTAWGRIDIIEGEYDQRRAVEFVERLRGRYDHGWTRAADCPPAAGVDHGVSARPAGRHAQRTP